MATAVGAVEAAMGGAPVRVWLDNVELPAAAFGGYTLRHGRRDVEGAPEPAQLSITVRTDLLTVGPAMGSPLRVELSDAALAKLYPRTSLAGTAGYVRYSTPWSWSANAAVSTLAELAGESDGTGWRISDAGGSVTYGKDAANRIAVTAGQTYTFGVSARRNIATGASCSEKLAVVWYTSAGQTIRTDSTTVTNSALGEIRRLVLVKAAPATATSCRVDVITAGTVAGASVDVDALTVEAGTTDGSAFDLEAKTRARVRFTGRVSDLTATPASRRQPQPLTTLTAVGIKSRLYVKVGDTPWPEDLSGNRLNAIYSAAKARRPELPNLLGNGSGSEWVVARDVDSQPASALLDELASSIGADLVEWPDGRLWWRTLSMRRNGDKVNAGQATVTGHDLLVPSSFKQSPTGVVNDLTVSYGAGGSSSVRVVDKPAAADDLQDGSLSTQLRDAWAADQRARSLVSRRSRPRWRMQGMATELRATTLATFADLLALVPAAGALVRVRGLPTSGPYVDGRLFVEGRTETLSRDRWQLDLDVVEYALGAPPPRIRDVPGYSGTSPTGQGGQRWSWKNQTTVAAPVAGTPVTFKSLRTTNPTLTVLAAGGQDFDPLR